MEAASITGWRAMTLTYGADGTLECLFVEVDCARPDVADFLADYDHCGDRTSWDWACSPRSLAATVGLDILHTCGAATGLRLEFDLFAQRVALERLEDTQTLLVGASLAAPLTGPVAAVAVDAGAVREAVAAAETGLRTLTAAFN